MAARLELLKEQFFDDDGVVLSGGKLHTYIVGTDTPKVTYTTLLGNVAQPNPVVLDADGRIPSDLYGVGAYKIVIMDSSDNTIDTIPTVSGVNSSSFTTIGDYSGDFDAAITAISTTATTLYVDIASTMSANVTVPVTCKVVMQKGGSINQSTYSLTFNGPFECGPYQAFTGTGTVSFGNIVHEILPEWMGDVDGTSDDVQINAAITAATNNQVIKAYAATYTCSSSIAMNKSCTLSLGQTALTSTADPVIDITADDVSIIGINRKKSQLISSTAGASIIRSIGASRKGITVKNLYLEGPATAYVAQGREYETLIHLGDDPYVAHITDVLIDGCYITKGIRGILMQHVNDSRIINNTFNHDHVANLGINLWSCDRVIIEKNTFLDSGGSTGAIEIVGATDNQSKGNVVNSNTFLGSWLYEAIRTTGSSNKIISNEIECDGNLTAGIELLQSVSDAGTTCHSNIVSKNNIKLTHVTAGSAITLKRDGGTNTVARNIISENIIDYYGNSNGINLGQDGYSEDNKAIENIIISDGVGNDGIYLPANGSSGNIIKGNDIAGWGRYGINALADQTRIESNDVTGCGSSGIQAADGANFIVVNNRSFSNTGYGILFATGVGIKRFSGNLAYSNTAGQVQKGSALINCETLTGVITIDQGFDSGKIDSSGGAVTATLGDGIYIGQIKTIVMTEASTSSTVSITHHQTSDPEVATFDAVDETGVFMWTGTEWITIFSTCTFV